MAKKKYSKRPGGSAKKAAQKVKVLTRRVVEKSTRAVKRAAGWKITKKDLIISVAGAAGGAIAAPVASGFMPASIPDVVKNGALAVAGGAVAYYGLKKKNMAIAGVGMGMAASSGAMIAKGFMSSSTVSGPIAARSLILPPPTMAAPFRDLAACPTMAAPFAEEEDFI